MHAVLKIKAGIRSLAVEIRVSFAGRGLRLRTVAMADVQIRGLPNFSAAKSEAPHSFDVSRGSLSFRTSLDASLN